MAKTVVLVGPHDLHVHACTLVALLRRHGLDPTQPFSVRRFPGSTTLMYTHPPVAGEALGKVEAQDE